MTDDNPGPFEGGQDEPGDWLPGPFMDPSASKRPRPNSTYIYPTRRQYSKNGPLSPSMRCCLSVMARWGGPMTPDAIRDLMILTGNQRCAVSSLKALEARGMVDRYHHQPHTGRHDYRMVWVLTPAGERQAARGG